MYQLTYRLLAPACWILFNMAPLAAQQPAHMLDASQKRFLFKPASNQPTIQFQNLIPHQPYALTIPVGANPENSCLPSASVLSPEVQILENDKNNRRLIFQSTATSIEFTLHYPCSLNEDNAPLHYISLENLGGAITVQNPEVTAANKPKTVQANADIASIQVGDFFVGPEGGSQLFLFSMANNCNSWSASGVPSWMTVGYSGNLNVSITVSENTTDLVRTANFVISGCGNTVSFYVEQRGAVMEIFPEAPEILVKDVFVGGNCMDVSNVTFSGSGQIGKFTNGLGSIDLSTGIILTTGDLEIAPGPNDQDGASGGGGGNGESDIELQSIATGAIFDKSAIEFDFVPTQSTVSFEFVFASEEYCEYVNTAFSDVFGLFISGPGITGTRNLAVVPGGNTPVGLNTVNHMVNSNWYVPNTPAGLNNCESGGVCGCLSPQAVAGLPGTVELQYDGFTKKMTATIAVTPCATYHLKMAIANVGDGIFDSALFIKSGLSSGSGKASVDWVVDGDSGLHEAVEGCNNVTLVIDRLDSNTSQPLPVTFAISGTATNNIDYGPINNTYVLPVGVDQLSIPVNIVNDGIPEGAQTIVLTLNNTCSCLNPQEILTIVENTAMTPIADTVYLCGPGVATITVNVSGGAPPYSFHWNTGSTEPSLTAFVSLPTNYTVTITDACGQTATALGRANVLSASSAQILPPAPQLCPGQSGQLLINFIGTAPFVYTYQINGVIQSPISGIAGGIYNLPINQPGTFQGVSVTDGNGCPGIVAGVSLVTNSNLNLTGVTFNASCHNIPNGSINTTVTGGQGPYQYIWSGPSVIGSIPDPTNILPGNYQVTVIDNFSCTAVQSFIINAPQCQWPVYPTGRNHTIILPATLSSDPDAPLQHGDWVGAFYDSLGTFRCAGYGIWSGSSIAFAVYGNDANAPAKNGFNSLDIFKIKVWRPSLNQEFDAMAQYAPVGTLGIVTHTNAFADDGISMINSISTAVSHPLANGWNMISSYIQPAQPNMLDVFSEIASSIDIVKDSDGSSMIPSFQINNIGDWDIRQGYQVKTNQKDTLKMAGPRVMPESTPISLQPGWQIIGYLLDRPQRVDSVFSAIKSQIQLVKDNQGRIYSPQFGINTIGDMQPCQGYKVNALSNTTLVYQPDNILAPTDDRAENNQLTTTSHFVLSHDLNTGNNATILLIPEAAKHLINSGDEIGVFSNTGLLCGVGTYQNAPLALTVWGDDPTTPSMVEGLKQGEPYQFKLWNSIQKQEFVLRATAQSNHWAYAADAIVFLDELQFELNSGSEPNNQEIHSVEVYPNPASENLQIMFKSRKSGQLQMTLIGADGSPQFDTETLSYSPSDNFYTVPVPERIVSGMYWLRIQFEDHVVNKSVCIKKQ